MTEEEIAFRAIPFFVSNPQNVEYTWSLNNEPFEINNSDKSVAVFRKTGAGAGRFPVNVTIRKEGSIFERASVRFDLSF